MTLKHAAIPALLAAGILTSTAIAGDQSAPQPAMVQRPMNQLLWLKPAAGQPTCPEGTALAVTTDAAGQQTGKPKCMPKPQTNSPDNH